LCAHILGLRCCISSAPALLRSTLFPYTTLFRSVKPGVTTEALDDLVLSFALDHGAVPASLNYRGFPKSICTSVNHVVCHGIPGPDRKSTRLNSSHVKISYAVFCLKKKKKSTQRI